MESMQTAISCHMRCEVLSLLKVFVVHVEKDFFNVICQLPTLVTAERIYVKSISTAWHTGRIVKILIIKTQCLASCMMQAGS